MRHNIAGSMVIFMAILTCLLLLVDISNEKESIVIKDTIEVDEVENQVNLTIVENQQ